MFLDDKPQGEIAQTLKPSAAIRKGHSQIAEYPRCYLRAGRGCALGAMWIGYGRTEEEWSMAHQNSDSPMGEPIFASVLGLPLALVDEISIKHFKGMPRLEIADWLEAQGL